MDSYSEMLSAKAFAQRMGALCEWIEKVSLCLMICIANQVAMLLVGVWGYYSFYSNSEWVLLYECLRSMSHCLRFSHSELERYARGLIQVTVYSHSEPNRYANGLEGWVSV
ncbi:hypothetical protein LR48_Vigan01g249000 [Vigna angularis]|uniref:Uncharacterized protein n=1 Tax=Phaseolus angularis TaxID=3914 RepID=A0A0L9TS04_PHAAN|nr:hypothetical protein LR48_Vigan01g249000 [Vigna angularis]